MWGLGTRLESQECPDIYPIRRAGSFFLEYGVLSVEIRKGQESLYDSLVGLGQITTTKSNFELGYPSME